jgi:hypothetical protein
MSAESIDIHMKQKGRSFRAAWMRVFWPEGSHRARRGFWLTMLIVGVTWIVWLTIFGSFYAGYQIHQELGSSSTPAPKVEDTSLEDNWSEPYTDSFGVTCDYDETDANNNCPS